MNINPDVRAKVERINIHTNRYPETDAGNEGLLVSLYDYMESFKEIMDGTNEIEMDYLCNQYPGFYRFGKLLEMIASGVADGIIDVPKDH